MRDTIVIYIDKIIINNNNRIKITQILTSYFDKKLPITETDRKFLLELKNIDKMKEVCDILNTNIFDISKNKLLMLNDNKDLITKINYRDIHKSWYDKNKTNSFLCYMEHLDEFNLNIISTLKFLDVYKKVHVTYLSFQYDMCPETDVNSYAKKIKELLKKHDFPEGDFIFNKGFNSEYLFKKYWLQYLMKSNDIVYYIGTKYDKTITDKLKLILFSNYEIN